MPAQIRPWHFILAVVCLISLMSWGLLTQARHSAKIIASLEQAQESLRLAEEQRKTDERNNNRLAAMLKKDRQQVAETANVLARQITILSQIPTDGCLDIDVPATLSGGEFDRLQGGADKVSAYATASGNSREVGTNASPTIAR